MGGWPCSKRKTLFLLLPLVRLSWFPEQELGISFSRQQLVLLLCVKGLSGVPPGRVSKCRRHVLDNLDCPQGLRVIHKSYKFSSIYLVEQNAFMLCALGLFSMFWHTFMHTSWTTKHLSAQKMQHLKCLRTWTNKKN